MSLETPVFIAVSSSCDFSCVAVVWLTKSRSKPNPSAGWAVSFNPRSVCSSVCGRRQICQPHLLLLNAKLLRYGKLYREVHISKSIFEKTFTEITFTRRPQICGGPHEDTFSYILRRISSHLHRPSVQKFLNHFHIIVPHIL